MPVYPLEWYMKVLYSASHAERVQSKLASVHEEADYKSTM